MAKYKKILVPVDGAASSLHALQETFKLTQNGISVISIVPPYHGDLRFAGVGEIEKLMRAPCDQAASLALDLAAEAGVEISVACPVGEPHEVIADIAASEDFDLVVMGLREDQGIIRFFMSGPTAKVIGYSTKDVLVIPEHASLNWKKILLAVDGSEASVKIVDRALDLAKSYNSELLILSALDLPFQLYGDVNLKDNLMRGVKGYLSEVKTEAEAMGIATREFLRVSKAPKAIVDLGREEQVNLIVMGSHGRTGLKRLFMGSVTEQVMTQAPCPLLIVKT
ncbi:universal stress protein [Desulfobacca acetoxidans]